MWGENSHSHSPLWHLSLAQRKRMPVDAALKCSDMALARYATTNPDPAPQIAKAAFDACTSTWQPLVDRLVNDGSRPTFDSWLNRYDHDWLRSKPRSFRSRCSSSMSPAGHGRVTKRPMLRGRRASSSSSAPVPPGSSYHALVRADASAMDDPRSMPRSASPHRHDASRARLGCRRSDNPCCRLRDGRRDAEAFRS